jgi:hypothetical protein
MKPTAAENSLRRIRNWNACLQVGNKFLHGHSSETLAMGEILGVGTINV